MIKKKVLAVLITVVMVMSLIACGGNTDSSDTAPLTEAPAAETAEETEGETPAEVAQPAAEDTITIMVPPVSSTYAEQLAVWAEDFKELYPHISVEIITTSWDEHNSKLTTMALAGEAPDIAEIAYNSLGTFVEMGTAINIADYMEEGRLADYDQNALDYLSLDNTVYGLPLYITVQALGGNRAMLEAAGADVAKIQTEGWSFDEFLQIAAAGTTADTVGFAFANAGVTASDYVSIFGVSAGISSNFTADLQYAYTSDNMLALLEAVETMTASGSMPDYAVEAQQRLVMLQTGDAMIIGKAMPLFENNVKTNIAAMADGSAAEGTIEMEYVFLPAPTMDNATESVYGAVDGFVALRNNNTTDEHLRNVLLFMDYICSGDRVAGLSNELYLSSVCESGRVAQQELAGSLDQSELNAAATARAISMVQAPPTGVTAEMSANAKTIMDEIIIPKFQALLAGEVTAQSVYDTIVTEAVNLFGEENCADGWIN